MWHMCIVFKGTSYEGDKVGDGNIYDNLKTSLSLKG